MVKKGTPSVAAAELARRAAAARPDPEPSFEDFPGLEDDPDDNGPFGDPQGDDFRPEMTEEDLLADALDAMDAEPKEDKMAPIFEYWQELNSEIVGMEERLKKKQAEMLKLEQVTLPNFLEELGVNGLSMADGSKIEKTTEYSASCAKIMEKVVKWLRDNGHEGLVKREVSVQFGKGEDARAEELVRRLKKMLGATPVADEQVVNTTTFKALMVELMQETDPKKKVTMDTAATLGISSWTRAKVTPAKPKTASTRG